MQKNEAGRLVSDHFAFYKDFYEAKANNLQFSFNTF